MVSEYISTIVSDNTMSNLVISVALAVSLTIVFVAFVVLATANHKHRANSLTWYKDQVIAFKVGYIHKKAKEEDIEMIYPPKTDLGKVLEEEISKDLNTP